MIYRFKGATGHQMYSTKAKKIHSARERVFSILAALCGIHMAKRHRGKFPQVAIFSFDQVGILINAEGRYEGQALTAITEFLQSRNFDLAVSRSTLAPILEITRYSSRSISKRRMPSSPTHEHSSC